MLACGDALPAAQTADVDFCPLGTGDGACAVEAVGGNFGLTSEDVAAVVDIKAVMQRGDVDFCRAGEGAAVGKALQQVQFEIHSADAAARAVQLRAVDGEFRCREQVAAF